MTDEIKDSRTLKESTNGQVATFIAIAGSLVGVISALSGLDRYVQIGIGAGVVVVLVFAFFKFVNVKKLRVEDFENGKRPNGDT